jgi:hypothetical protein
LNGVSAGEGTCVIQPDGKIVVRIGGFRGYADDLHISRASGALSQHGVHQEGEQFFVKME